MSEEMAPFDRQAVRRHRERAAAAFGAHEFLFAEAAERLVDRLDDMTRRFPVALDLGCHDGVLARALTGRDRIGTLIQMDLSTAMAARAAQLGPALVGDEERLPFRPGSFDAVLSCLSLHWVNDLPGALIQARQALKPDSLLLAAMLGGGSLRELRGALMAAEIDAAGGASPRISPFVDLRDAAGLLQRAGFVMPVADCDTLTVTYESLANLFKDLRGMGEANALNTRIRGFTRRSVLTGAAAHYAREGENGRLGATFELIFLTAWAPAQPRP